MLPDARTVAFVPSTDLNRSRRFYEEVLGLPVAEQDSFAVSLVAGAVTIRVTDVGDAFDVQPYTLLGWEVADIRTELADLVERGVGFLRVAGLHQDEAGVWVAPDGSQVVWFTDPDGNTLSLSQRTHQEAVSRG